MNTAIFHALFVLFCAYPKFEMDDILPWSEKLTSKTKIRFGRIKERQTRIKCGFVSVFVLLKVMNS